jgi:CheY-like chemotaxis protein/predicted regulator of Ras-like GTPase activity (Roadblock/LC7/MglB family)
METKRILVVDDDPDLLFLVAHGIKSLSPSYQVSTAASASMALEHVNKQRFDLVVTDYMMPEMTGLDLVPKVRQVSPKTQFVVMTAHHESNRLREVIENLNIGGFVSKPFVLPELLDVIQQVTSKTDEDSKTESASDEWPKEKIDKFLTELRRQINARNVLLVNAEGEPVHVIGENDPAKMSRLAAFVASDFLAITELATLFGDNDASFKSSYYEGNSYNIYAYNLNGEHFLSIIFDAEVKPGSVWFYTKQVAGILKKLLPTTANSLDHPSRDLLAKDFEDILG